MAKARQDIGSTKALADGLKMAAHDDCCCAPVWACEDESGWILDATNACSDTENCTPEFVSVDFPSISDTGKTNCDCCTAIGGRTCCGNEFGGATIVCEVAVGESLVEIIVGYSFGASWAGVMWASAEAQYLVGTTAGCTGFEPLVNVSFNDNGDGTYDMMVLAAGSHDTGAGYTIYNFAGPSSTKFGSPSPLPAYPVGSCFTARKTSISFDSNNMCIFPQTISNVNNWASWIGVGSFCDFHDAGSVTVDVYV